MNRIVVVVAGAIAAVLLARAFPMPKSPASMSREAMVELTKTDARVEPPALSARQFDVLLTRIERIDKFVLEARDANLKPRSSTVDSLDARLTEIDGQLRRIELRLAEPAHGPSHSTRNPWITKVVVRPDALGARAPK